MKPPAFQFYPDDFVGGTLDLTPHEVGCYIRLLCHQWNRGSIPVEPERLKNITGGDVSAHVLAKFQKANDGQLKNSRLEIERQKQADFRERQRQKGIASGLKRASQLEHRLNHGSATVQPSVEPKGNSPSPSPSPYSTKLIRQRGATKLPPFKKDLADRIESALGDQWVNDAGKWVTRIKTEPRKAASVIAEVELAIKENRIDTTPAQFAEDVWPRFQ